MALPNLCAPTQVTGKNAVLDVPTSASSIVSNGVLSGKSIRIVALYVANVDGTTTYPVTAELYDGTTATKLAYNVDVAAKTTVALITKDGPLYLMEGESIELYSTTANKLEAVASYEEIS